MKASDVFVVVLMGIALVLSVLLFAYVYRQFSEATVAMLVVEVEPGVRCARLVTGDGVAISCWRDE